MILQSLIKPKVFFDIDSKKHVEQYRDFLLHDKCGNEGCPFILEFPYLTIPDMIKDKLVHKFLKVQKLRYNESRY